jgi:hypothetical protein
MLLIRPPRANPLSPDFNLFFLAGGKSTNTLADGSEEYANASPLGSIPVIARNPSQTKGPSSGAGGFSLPVSVFHPCCLFAWRTKLMTNQDGSILFLEEESS